MNATIDLMKSHRSIRKFTDRDVDDQTLKSVIAAAQCAATSHFVQAYTVIRVRDRRKRQAIAELAGPQVWVARAPVFLVFCADMQRHQLACDMHGAEMLSGFTEQFLTASVDCALFAQNVLIAAESLGLGGCYIGAIRNKIGDVDTLLDLPEKVYPVFGMCLGYPDQDPETKPRLPVQVVLKQHRYGAEGDRQLIEEYDKLVRSYYRTRTGGKKDNFPYILKELQV